jgi:hypothetical protein
MFVEPLACWREVRVTARKTMVDWAEQVRWLVDHPRYVGVEVMTLVCDNLNTHDIGSLYEAFAPAEAMRIARKLQIVNTPKHGSWLNMAEPELSVLTRQALGDYLGCPTSSPRVRRLGGPNATTNRWASIGSSLPKMLGTN